MELSLEQLLKKNYVDGTYYTHISMIQPRGKFNFNREKLETFWDLYCDQVFKNINNLNSTSTIIGIAEKPQSYLPVLADIDLKIKESDNSILNNDKLYTQKHIMSIIEIYQSVIKEIVVDVKEEHLICVLLEKPLYKVSKGDISFIKNGFHLHFPYTFLSVKDQEIHLIPRVKNMVKETNLFTDIGFENPENCIDKNCCKVSWLLYGSRKSEDMQPYKVTKIYNGDCDELDLEETFKHYPIFDNKENLIKIENVEKYLPRILSIIPYGRDVCNIKTNLYSPIKEKLFKEKHKKQVKVQSKDALKLASKLLPLLADWRAEDRNEWMSVGWILYNIGEASDEAFELWLQFSARCDHSFDEGVCLYEWERMKIGTLGLGTLKHNAKMDSPEKYREITEEASKAIMSNNVHCTQNDIAKILHLEYSTEYVCASVTNKIWYKFNGVVWEPIEDVVDLRKVMTDDIAVRYREIRRQIYASITDDKQISDRITGINKLLDKLGSSSFKLGVTRELQDEFYDKSFRNRLDKNPYLIAFKNGVYDLKQNQFRKGRPEDYLSKTMGIEYKEFSEMDDKVIEVYNYIEKVFPDKSLRQYFLDKSSDVFVGGNFEKLVIFWIGSGDNSKSIMQTIFEKMFGELAIKFNTTVITGKKVSSGAADPERARAGSSIRWAVLEEPNADEEINIGTLKLLSGNDSYFARDCFEKGKETKEITPMFKLIFIANKAPNIKYADRATWNRIRLLPFESTFCGPEDPAPDTYEEQLRQKRFPKDPSFTSKIQELLEPFAWVLLEHRKKDTPRIEPEKVKLATALYRKQNDTYRQFIEERIVEENGKCLSIDELYLQFKEWYRNVYPGQTIINKNDVKEYFLKIWGNFTKGISWQGYRIRTLQDDNIDVNDVVMLDDNDYVQYKDNKIPI